MSTAQDELAQAFTDLRRRADHANAVHALRPLHDRVIIRPDERESVSPGGIVLPDVSKEKPQMGTVVAVGPGRIDSNGHRHKCEVTAGDHVLFGKYAGSDITIDGEKLLIVRDEDCIAVVTSDHEHHAA